jgi:hypothetical protein
MKHRLSAIVTCILLAGTFGLLSQRERLTGFRQSENPEPVEVIWRMTDAAREGNSKAYLDCFTGDLEQVLRRTAAEMGETKFSEHLKQLNADVTGIAVASVEDETGQSERRLDVEFVYRGRNESQQHYFRLVDGRWRIDRLDDGQHLKVLIPYGTSVKDALPGPKGG